jgi:uncharacterized membrane protein YraQ (UPF0718 family)
MISFLANTTLPDPSRSGDVLMAFLSILFEGAPYILIGTILSGFIDAFLPAKLLDRVLPKNKVLATLIAGFLGLIFPVCECAVVPVVRRLVQKGLPLSCAMTYLLSAPIINPIVAVSTLTAFKEFQGITEVSAVLDATMTIGRLSLGYVVAVLVGLLMLKFRVTDILRANVAAAVVASGNALSDVQTAVAPFNDRLIHAMRTAMRDFLDTGMYFTIGVIITSVFNTQVDQAKVDAFASSEWLAIPSMMSLGFVLSLCSTSDAFIAAPMAAFSMASKLAFLVFGPMMDVKLVFMYAAVFKRRVVVAMLLGLFVLIGLLSGPWITLMEYLASLN